MDIMKAPPTQSNPVAVRQNYLKIKYRNSIHTHTHIYTIFINTSYK